MLVSQLEVPVATVARARLPAPPHTTRRCCSIPRPRSRCSTRARTGRLLVVNETEAESLTGIAVGDDVRRARRRCVVREGRGQRAGHARRARRAGAAVGNGRLRAMSVVAVDTTAAGDTFVGGAAARAGGASMDDAIGFGQRAAAISVTRHGAQTSIPTRDEVACLEP